MPIFFSDGTRFKIIICILLGLVTFGLLSGVLAYQGKDIPDILVAVVSAFSTQLGNSIVPYFKSREDLQALKDCKL